MDDEKKTKSQLLSELKKLRRRVAQLEEQAKSLVLNESHDGVAVTDRDGRITWLNTWFTSLFGYKPQEVRGKQYELVWQGPATDQETTRQISDALKASREFKGEFRGYPKNGRPTWISISITPIHNAEAVVTGFVIVHRSVDAVKRMEEMWRRNSSQLMHTEHLMTIIDSHHSYTAVNEAYCRAQNRSPEAIVGRSVAEVWGEDNYTTQIKPRLEKCFAGEELHYQSWFDFAVMGYRLFDVSYYPFHDEKNDITHVVVVSRDITDIEGNAVSENDSQDLTKPQFSS